jgi:hypothetical protein
VAARPRVFVDDFKELVDSCVSFYVENEDKMGLESVRERRGKLSGFVEVFHKDCGTLTPSVQRRIEDLRNGVGLVLMTAHQPNFFAYSGVFRKATLIFVLAKRLEEMLKVPVVNFFGIADQDFTDDRWVRSCQLPAVQRSGGILSIDVKLPEKLMLNRVAKPSSDVLNGWRSEIEKWLNDAVRSVEGLCKALGFPEMCSTSSVSTLRENFMSFWSVVEGCYGCSENYSDFNAFVMSKIVNDVWGYDTVFSRFSECQQAFADEFGFLLSRFGDYSRLLREASEMPHDERIGGGVSDQEPLLAPFWYHCDCGSKVKLFLREKAGSLFGEGNCVGCGKLYELEFGTKNDPDISNFASRISARALSMPLVFFNGLMPSCYVGGVGGIRYLMEAEHVADGLGIAFPPIVVWRPRDKYLGVGQIEALLELKRIRSDLGVRDVSAAKDWLESRVGEIRERLDKLDVSKERIVEKLRKNPHDEELKEEIKKVSISQTEFRKSSNLSVISHELKILENVSTVLDLIPSILDYAVNVGLKETSDQWIRHLGDDGSLSSDVHLESVLNQNVKLDAVFWKDVSSLYSELL